MPYKTVTIPDEKMLVSSEKSLDDKFKPEAEWRTTFLKGEHAKKEVLGEVGDLKEGILKIKTQLDLNDDMGHKIPILIYIKAAHVNEIMERESKHNKEFSRLNLVGTLRGLFNCLNRFYECKKCGGYIAGTIEPKEYDEIGPLCGTAGVDYPCTRCGHALARYVVRRA